MVDKASAMIREGPDYQAVLPDHGAPMLPDTEYVAGVRDDPCVWNDIKALARCYCHINVGTFVLVHERGWGIIVCGDRHKGWTVEFMDYTTGLYACSDGDDDTPTEFEAYRTFNKWGEHYYWTRPEVRKEFAPWWKEHGEIHFLPTIHDDRTRVEYTKDHKHHREIRHYDGDKLSRVEYSEGHKCHGEIRYYDGSVDKLTHIEYSEGHKCHGQIVYFDGRLDKLTRIEYSERHKWHGEIHYFDGNLDKLTRIEFPEGHNCHGEIRYYDRTIHKLTRVEFSKHHKYHGQVHYYADGSHDKLIRVEFQKHGIIRHYDKDNNMIREEFDKGHLLHGEVRHYEDGKLTKIDFPDGRSFVPEEKKRKVVEVIVVED